MLPTSSSNVCPNYVSKKSSVLIPTIVSLFYIFFFVFHVYICIDHLHTYTKHHQNSSHLFIKLRIWRTKIFHPLTPRVDSILFSYEWAKRPKLLLAVIYESPRQHSNSFKIFKKMGKKLKYIFWTIFGLAESFKTMNRLGPTVTLFDVLFIRKYKR